MRIPAFTSAAPLQLRCHGLPTSKSPTTPYPTHHAISRTAFLPSIRQPALHHPSPPSTRTTVRPSHPPKMSLSKVVIAGGTGFIGSRIIRNLQSAGTAVTVLTRSSSAAANLPKDTNVVVWAPDKLSAVGDDWLGWEKALANADLVINLCGEPVVARWDDAGKKSIVESRVKSTTALAEAIAKLPLEERPKCFASASAVGYYGTSAAAEFDESASPAQNDFLADVCVQWEKAATEPLQNVAGTRLVIIRIGVVMGVGGGALARMLPAFKFFVGGPIGSGEQWVSWVHIDDLARVFIEAGENQAMRGAYNATAPEPVTMGQLSQALADALRRPNLFPVPGFVLKLALGGASQVVLEGQKVYPKKLLDTGFKFKHEKVDSAMQAVAEEA